MCVFGKTGRKNSQFTNEGFSGACARKVAMTKSEKICYQSSILVLENLFISVEWRKSFPIVLTISAVLITEGAKFLLKMEILQRNFFLWRIMWTGVETNFCTASWNAFESNRLLHTENFTNWSRNKSKIFHRSTIRISMNVQFLGSKNSHVGFRIISITSTPSLLAILIVNH